MTNKLISFLTILLIFPAIYSQEDLAAILEGELEDGPVHVLATFKSTRVMNSHSVETMPDGQLDVRISHRFGRINTGAYELWGLDQAYIHLAGEYGITDWFMVGVGRANYNKTYDGFLKFRILRQSSGQNNQNSMPISLGYVSGMTINSTRWEDPDRDNHFRSRLGYAHQVNIARKFGNILSLQLSPTLIHRNLVELENDPNDLFSMGVSTSFRLTRFVSLNLEYFHLLESSGYSPTVATYNPLSIGFDILTGGHVFQLIFTNSIGMVEKNFITETSGQWEKGDIHFGFNISRVFMLKSDY